MAMGTYEIGFYVNAYIPGGIQVVQEVLEWCSMKGEER
jgi:hypothetical protein